MSTQIEYIAVNGVKTLDLYIVRYLLGGPSNSEWIVPGCYCMTH